MLRKVAGALEAGLESLLWWLGALHESTRVERVEICICNIVCSLARHMMQAFTALLGNLRFICTYSSIYTIAVLSEWEVLRLLISRT